MATHLVALRCQLTVYPGASIGSTRGTMRRLDVERHRPVRSCTRAFGAFGPSVEARRRYLQHPADQHHRKFGLLCPYESVSHCDSLAKKAVAFFNMSRSIRSCRFSRRSCDISSRSAVLKTLPPPRPASASLRDTQLRTADSVNPRSRATAAIPFPPSRTRQTTSALYSGVHARLFLVMGHLHRALSPYLRCPLNPGTSRSPQNRPMGMTRDGVVLPLWKGTRQARFSPPAPWAVLEDVAVV